MKLKKAVKVAKSTFKLERGIYYITVDEDGRIFLYRNFRPGTHRSTMWLATHDNSFLGLLDNCTYSGKKHWTKAIRKFVV